jgi:16S rRNA (guanine(966)-N(2))-methyltransferase RsmD
MLHIIGGQARGMRLRAPKGMRTRPTSGRVRTSLFSILSDVVPGARVADLFAGSGALGLEALSRGASFCCFVESARPALAALDANIERLRMADRSELLRCNAFTALPVLHGHGPFDILFLDPPYPLLRQKLPRFLALLGDLAAPALLSPDGIVVVQHRADTPLPDTVGPLVPTDRRDYRDTAITLLEHPERAPSAVLPPPLT